MNPVVNSRIASWFEEGFNFALHCNFFGQVTEPAQWMALVEPLSAFQQT